MSEAPLFSIICAKIKHRAKLHPQNGTVFIRKNVLNDFYKNSVRFAAAKSDNGALNKKGAGISENSVIKTGNSGTWIKAKLR